MPAHLITCLQVSPCGGNLATTGELSWGTSGTTRFLALASFCARTFCNRISVRHVADHRRGLALPTDPDRLILGYRGRQPEWKLKAMIENRDLTIDDYLAMLRRRVKMILIPALLAPMVGFLVSCLYREIHLAALVLVEGQKVPRGVVQPVVTADLGSGLPPCSSRSWGQTACSRSWRSGLGLFTGGKSLDDVLEDVRASMQIEPVVTDLSAMAIPDGKRKPGQGSAYRVFM